MTTFLSASPDLPTQADTDEEIFRRAAKKIEIGGLRAAKEILLGSVRAPLTEVTASAIDDLVSPPVEEDELNVQLSLSAIF